MENQSCRSGQTRSVGPIYASAEWSSVGWMWVFFDHSRAQEDGALRLQMTGDELQPGYESLMISVLDTDVVPPAARSSTDRGSNGRGVPPSAGC